MPVSECEVAYAPPTECKVPVTECKMHVTECKMQVTECNVPHVLRSACRELLVTMTVIENIRFYSVAVVYRSLTDCRVPCAVLINLGVEPFLFCGSCLQISD